VVGQPVYEAEGGRTTVGTLLGGPLRHSRGRATTPEPIATPTAPQGWPTTHHTLVFNFFSFFFFLKKNILILFLFFCNFDWIPIKI